MDVSHMNFNSITAQIAIIDGQLVDISKLIWLGMGKVPGAIVHFLMRVVKLATFIMSMSFSDHIILMLQELNHTWLHSSTGIMAHI